MSLGRVCVRAGKGSRGALSYGIASVDDIGTHDTKLTIITNHTALSAIARIIVNDGRCAAARAS